MVQYYFGSTAVSLPGYVSLQYGFGLAIAVGLYAGLCLLMLRSPGVPKGVVLFMTVFVLMVQFGRALILLRASPEVASAIRMPAIVLISIYLLFLGAVLYRASILERHELMALLLRRLSVLTLIFAPASTVYYLVSYRFPAIGRLQISLDYIYFLVWSIVTIAVLLRYLSRPTVLLDDNGVSDSFVSSYKITKREAEVVALISLGLSNQQIADRLHVSLTTIRTHVYNVFQKTGAHSRVHLLRIVSNSRQ
jgi:DNA-binding CsgD family transcriptional regulator